MHNTRTAVNGELYLRLMRYVIPYWDTLILALVSLLAMAATVPLLPVLAWLTLDGFFIGRNPDLVQLIPLGIMGLLIIWGVTGQIGLYAISWVGNKLALDLRVRVFSKLMFLPVPLYTRNPAIRLVSMVTSHSARIAAAFVDISTILIRDSFAVIGLLAWVFYLDWVLASLMLILTSVILLAGQLIVRRIQNVEIEAGEAMKAFEHGVKDPVENYLMVKLHSAEQYESQRLKEQAESMRRFVMRKTLIASFWIPAIQLASAVVLGTVVYLVAQQAFAEEITTGTFISLAGAMLLLIAPLKRISTVSGILRRGLSDADALFSLLDQEPESDNGTVDIPRARGELRFEQVGYCEEAGSGTGPNTNDMGNDGAGSGSGAGHYPLLRDVTLTIPAGQTAVLVGLPGSTMALANMIPRFVEPTSGHVLLDGHDLGTLTLSSLRSNIALISGRAMLFNDTIAANIAYGAGERATEAMITAVAHAAHVSEFLREMPQGLQTVVGEDGVELDPGQRLRIAIARALLKDAPVLILEEPAGADDNVCTSHVRAALETVVRERTALIIANCLRTLERADRIIVLDKGEVVSMGSHRELLARDERYGRFLQTLAVPESEGLFA